MQLLFRNRTETTLVLLLFFSLLFVIAILIWMFSQSPRTPITIPEGVSIDDVITGRWKYSPGHRQVISYRPSTYQKNIFSFKCVACFRNRTIDSLRDKFWRLLSQSEFPCLVISSPFRSLLLRPLDLNFNSVLQIVNQRKTNKNGSVFVTVINRLRKIPNADSFYDTSPSMFYEQEGINLKTDFASQSVGTKAHKTGSINKEYSWPPWLLTMKHNTAECLSCLLDTELETVSYSRLIYLLENLVYDMNSEMPVIVLIQEYLHESLILLKRHSGLTIKDILHRITDDNTDADNSNFNEIHKEENARSEVFNEMIYNYFNRTFWTLVSREGEGFAHEVAYLKQVQMRASRFCTNVAPYGDAVLEFPSSPWSPAFNLSTNQC